MPGADPNGRLKRLLENSKRRGYVPYADLEQLLLEDFESESEFADLLVELANAAIRDEPKIRFDEDIAQELDHPDPAIDDPVRVYLREVCAVPRLTPEKEIELAKRIERLKRETETAKKDLIEANLWLVIAIARHFADRGVHILDLVQAGNTGLLRAAENFDYWRGYAFSTYSAWWVRRAILRAISQSNAH